MVMPSWVSNPVNTGKSISDPAPVWSPITSPVASLQVGGGSTLFSGTGAPSVGTGVNGDFYFRVDTPGTANQRIYVKSAGAWTGVV